MSHISRRDAPGWHHYCTVSKSGKSHAPGGGFPDYQDKNLPEYREPEHQCKHGSFLALEASGVNTRAYCAAHPNGLDLPVENLWEFGRFLLETIGKP